MFVFMLRILIWIKTIQRPPYGPFEYAKVVVLSEIIFQVRVNRNMKIRVWLQHTTRGLILLLSIWLTSVQATKMLFYSTDFRLKPFAICTLSL